MRIASGSMSGPSSGRGTRRYSGPTSRRSTGSVTRRTPSISMTVDACPKNVTRVPGSCRLALAGMVSLCRFMVLILGWPTGRCAKPNGAVAVLPRGGAGTDAPGAPGTDRRRPAARRPQPMARLAEPGATARRARFLTDGRRIPPSAQWVASPTSLQRRSKEWSHHGDHPAADRSSRRLCSRTVHLEPVHPVGAHRTPDTSSATNSPASTRCAPGSSILCRRPAAGRPSSSAWKRYRTALRARRSSASSGTTSWSSRTTSSAAVSSIAIRAVVEETAAEIESDRRGDQPRHTRLSSEEDTTFWRSHFPT